MVASEFKNPKSYSQEEIQQILKLAIARQTHQEDFSREQLWEIGVELDIPPECIQAAERDWLSQKLVLQKRHDFDAYRKEQFRHKLGRHTIFNTFLITFDLISSGHFTWSIYILLASGLIVSLGAWKTYHSNGEAYEEAFQKWERKRQLKLSVQSLWQTLQKAWQSQTINPRNIPNS
ncbi:MAG: 2TM domain-containing protein [Okeania sp. SIO2D1]|nr:2TM domain-containing protein [Okeania sp. SIO2D1]